MNKNQKKASDPLVREIGLALMPGRFVKYDAMIDFVRSLEQVAEKIKARVDSANVAQALSLYEIFLSGCYEKIEECDDSSAYLSMFFDALFCQWVEARQRAGRPAAETVQQILKWKEHDQYGFCHDIEKDVVKVIEPNGYQLLVTHFQTQLDAGLTQSAGQPHQAIFEYPNEVRLPALSLKDIYQAKGDASCYSGLCERLGFSPRDCELLAEMEMAKGDWGKALEWVEKGLALEPTRNWHNEDSFSLAHLKPKILGKLGRKEDALAMAWRDFEVHPSDMAYEDFMKYVPKDKRTDWHERAMKVVAEADIGSFMDLCVKTREWERLAARIHTADPVELEGVSHYSSEPAAQGLAKRDGMAAAKLYQALCLRILNSKKSKYYDAALEHLQRARDLHLKGGRHAEWAAIVHTIRAEHSRKHGFMGGFEQLVAGELEKRPSFADRARKRWADQTS